ncbi:MAG: PAS domain S-box protein [Flavipsychrobacter sp.]|nr:PAS domain S-box protein [Flavipsychrobacter sp.]
MILSNAFNRNLFIGFIAAIVITTVVTLVAYKTIKSTINADDWVSHTHQVMGKTQAILLELADAEDDKDDYIFFGNSKQLKDYYQSINHITHNLDTLRQFVSDNPTQVSQIDSLATYIGITLRHMSALLSARQDERFNSIQLEDSIQDAEIARCRQIGYGILENEKKLLVSRKQTGIERADYAIRIILFSAISVISILGFLFVFISRTFLAKQKLRAQLKLSESMFADAFEDSGIGMALVSLKGNLMDVNPHLLQLLGYSKEELIAKTFQEITYPDDLEADLALLHRVLKGELDTYKMEKRYFHKEGYIVWTMLTVSLVHYENGEPRFFVSQIEDITATRNMIQELELKNQVLLQTSAELENRIGQLEEFNRIVAHNLRGPAGGIEMMLDIILEEKNPAEKEDMLRLVLGSSRSLNATLQDLMQVLEIKLNQDIEYSNCDLTQIVQTATQMLQGDILHSKASIHTSFLVSEVKFPRVYLESLFYNLISNSLKYRKENVPVEINISSRHEDGKTRIVFEDNGLGIDLTRYGQQIFKLNKIFHKGFDSRGVGLFITKNQLEMHGGSISVESTPGVGTRFIVYL